MSLNLRKIARTAHFTFSVGWLGALVFYLALAIAGLASHDAQMARAAYVWMELIGCFVFVPLSIAALLSGPSTVAPHAGCGLRQRGDDEERCLDTTPLASGAVT